ncbi:FAD-dependent oxidoreductase [Streptomyces sp. NRRL F-4428]|uniref:FAD-dependent oxidoreductase n=1 Tax=Streptomyces sp. NRRL F-4428 TaxID=1609137 RepID=UPI0005ECF9F9|nr:FAD-dependent monooxygenase [Streptomyces sp. NRRL F-4428]KJK43104.1 pentachlorophenol monooxygenase [Streptomyces sp. NRRL F-4428]
MTSTAALPLRARTEVAVVGAGPTGLALAVTLAEAGVDFVLLDRQAEGANTSRAAVVHARTLEVFDELDPSGALSADLVGRGVPVSRFGIRDGARPLAAVDFDGLSTAHPYALMVPQYETEAVLLRRLRALGGDVHRPYEVTAVAQDAGGATLTTATGETLRAAHVVGADGMHSAVRAAAGIAFEGGSYGESFVLADVAMDWAPGPREVSLAFGTAGLVVIAPLPGGRYRIVATVAEAPAEPDLAFVRGLLDERVPGQAAVRELVWSSRFRIHHRVADRYRAGRLLLAGDAAHVHSPAGGQGMNTGIQDGYALGRALAAGDLDAYEAARRPVALRVVALTHRMTRVATTRNRALRAVRNAVLPVLARIPALRVRLATELAELRYR